MNPYFFAPVDTLRDILLTRVEKSADEPLFVWDDYRKKTHSVVTAAEFAAQAEALGAYLHELCPRSHIALLGENSYAWLLCYFGVTCSGSVAVLPDKNLSEFTLLSLLGYADCDVLLYSDAYRDTALSIAEKGGFTAYPMSELSILATQRSGEGFWASHPLSGENDAVLAFTSGTSGTSKGVLLTHRNISRDIVASARFTKATGRSVLLLPLHHLFGMVAGVLGTMIWGNTIYINQSLRYLPQDLMQAKPTLLCVVPAMLPPIFKVLSMMKREEPTKIICGGAPPEKVWFDRFHSIGVPIYNGYGMTECSPIIAIDSELFDRQDTSMKPLGGVEVRVIDKDKDGIGEVCVRGETVMGGYYKLPEETAAALQDGWLHTGDLGRLDENGFLSLTGRKKNLIVLPNGENVSPELLERALLQLPNVNECVVSLRDGLLKAEIYSEDGDRAVIREGVFTVNREFVASHRIADVIFRDTEFPKNSSHKIIRQTV